MDNTADGSTPRIHWQVKLWCLVSCVFPTWFVLHDLIKFEYFTDEKFQSLGVLWELCHPSRIDLDGWHSTQSTPRIRIFIPLFYVYILYAFIMWINIFQFFWKISGSAPNVIILFKMFIDQGPTDGWRCKRSTPRIHRWTTLQMEHTKDPPMDYTADGALQGSTDGLHCRWSTPRIHRWTTLQNEHTKDPLTGEAAMSCDLRVSYLFCAAWLNQIRLFYSFRVLEQHGSTAAKGAHKGSTERLNSTWYMLVSNN